MSKLLRYASMMLEISMFCGVPGFADRSTIPVPPSDMISDIGIAVGVLLKPSQTAVKSMGSVAAPVSNDGRNVAGLRSTGISTGNPLRSGAIVQNGLLIGIVTVAVLVFMASLSSKSNVLNHSRVAYVISISRSDISLRSMFWRMASRSKETSSVPVV